MKIRFLILTLSGVLLLGCDALSSRSNSLRGATAEQLALGDQVFKTNCQVCHGEKASGVVRDWQNRLPDGTLPAPPLNGTAHAWHHNDAVLLRTINQGGIPLGGTMPGFRDTLDKEEKQAVLAYIKSLWPEELYQAWSKRNG